jgi:glutamine cyclotransferase
VLVESTGRYGRSDRRRVDLATGEVLASEPLPDDHFGEGLTVVGDRLIQLTWQEGIAHVADADTLAPLDTWRYDGEGWGLCHDGDRLVMSDGSATLRFRDADTFTETGAIEVTRDGEPVTRLNELECNVWGATDIVAIDPASGEVRAVVDASALVPDGVDGDAVLNGIARRPGRETFWLTGKLWPVLYEVELIPAGGP